jgi:hypothetical protein
MNDLRQQLESARSEYESVRYPGNLAAEVLPPRTHIVRRLFIGAAAMGAIAAAVALWMPIQPLTTRNVNTPMTISIVKPTTTSSEESFAIAVPEVPMFPEGIQLMPTDQSLALPSVPTFPSLAELEREAASSTATTQEAVL